MIRLDLMKEPRWIDLGFDVRVKVAPISTSILSAASTSPAMRDLAADTHQDVRFAVLSGEVAKLAILEWEGVGDAEGQPIEPAPETIAALMDIYVLAKAFTQEYVARGLLVSAEKNV